MFAPGHLGELTRIVPFEMVDEVLAECGAIQQRLRKLPARVVVYLLLAAALFEECGYLAVWDRLTCALGSLPIPKVTGTALWNARARLGVRPVRSLFDMLRGPASAIRTAGARWAGLLVVAIDGTYLDVPDDPATRARLGKGSNQYATSGYPQICLVALVACGTRAVIDAVFGPRSRGETTHGKRLARSLRAGMVVLLDRGLSSNAFLETVAGTGAAFLARLSAARKPPVLHRFDDGSFLSRIGQLEVRIIECEITIATTAGRHTGVYRLATTLLDHRRYPAFELVKLYHQRWEVESTYFAIKKSMLGRRVLRARTMAGIAQEVYALLTAYQLIRIAIADATDTVPRRRPRPRQLQHRPANRPRPGHPGRGRDRRHHHRPRRQHRPRGLEPPDAPAPPARQPRAVKRPLSRYAYKSLRVDRRTYKATISIDILLTDPISP
ncbi:IS4 family transposase [Streptomyces sp. NBC_00316]|uniref:IS4 family transposase n=1 Tax=Streptomyces sp. NBC_00316 TaxID=2975710 RepID=UPI002E28C5EE|nr:IS4 family transposase [Streptomyces sp. NBC_00316]